MATNCLSITSGYCGSICKNSVGGVSRVYLANYADVDPTTITKDTDGAITELDIDTLYAFVPYSESSNFVENIQVSVENGTIFYEQVVNLVLGTNSQALRNCVEQMGGAGNIVVIVLTNDGRYWFVGDYTGKRLCYLSAGEMNRGTAFGDRNGASLTFTAKMPTPSPEMLPADSSALATAIASADAVCDGTLS